MNRYSRVVVFGGTGFIGTHLCQHLLQHELADTIFLVDVAPPRKATYARHLQHGLANSRVHFVEWDVRNPIPDNLIPSSVDLTFNFAAVHREPGHQPIEYYQTNLRGAENVCTWTSSMNCSRMVFTSSISPYGPCDERKDEESLPAPETPYGGSKLVAEKIHLIWQSKSPDRRLLILRPGVVFGPGENGNVTRLVRSLIKGYFVYVGNKDTRKAGLYIRELARVMQFGIEHQERTGEAVTLFNAGMCPTPRLEDFVNAIREVAELKRTPLAVPRRLLLGVSYPVDAVSRVFGIKQPVSPVRIRKLYRSTHVEPTRLRQLGYHWEYSLEGAFRDWKAENPDDFSR